MSRPVLIDADPGCDDAVAIGMALSDPSLEVVGISSVFGNAPVTDTTENTLGILEAFDRPSIPVASGCETPLHAELETGEVIHGEGGIRGELPEPTMAPADTHGVAMIIEMAREHDGELVIMALGPLTNLAIALAIEPDLPALVDEVLVMGGSAFAPGNVTPVSEANFYHDPAAAHRVVSSLSPTVVGLDVTAESQITAAEMATLPDAPLRDLVTEWLTYYPDWLLEKYGIDRTLVHDAVVTAAIIDPAVIETETYPLAVLTAGGIPQGQLVCDVYGAEDFDGEGAVALELDRDRFAELVIDRMGRLLEDGDP